MKPTDTGEGAYRVARIRERLAGDDIAELGVRVEERGGAVLLTGTVSSPEQRDGVLRAVAEELGDDTPVRSDLVVASTAAPDAHEDLP
ncbi:BON domain-containing protein [Streptomyces sp. NPDC019507]|uniref:BON domain-containing protein n=1 Tax=Streptomyces sp. NPDC019507 TaxID=3154689 RepID=UPI0033F63B6E